MRLLFLRLLFFSFSISNVAGQTLSDPVKQSISQGDLYQSKHKYDLAQQAYQKADKISHHTSAEAFLKLAAVDRKLGDFSSALDEAKKALKVAGENKMWATQAHLVHANLLVQMASKPGDKKLKEAEEDIRQAITLDPAESIAHFNLGFVLLKQERDAEGIAELKTYIASASGESGKLTEAEKMIANPIRARAPFAPDFSFVSHEKEAISNANLRGKVVLMDFWGTWCPPCRASVPVLHNLQKKYSGKGFQIVSVSSDDDEDVWRTFIEAQRMDWSEYIDLSGEVLEAFKIESFPTYIVLDKDGVMRFRQSGFADTTQGDLKDAINKALKRPSDPNLMAAAAAASPSESRTPRNGEAEESAKKSTGRENASEDPSTSKESALLHGNETGAVFRDEQLGLTYRFPQGWVAAKPEALRAVNEKLESSAKASILQQHPEAGENMRLMTPKIIFYASRRGDGDGQHLSFPCVRIMAMASRASSLQLETFQKMTEAMANASGAKVSLAGAEYRVKDHSFLRADFERSMAGQRILQTYIQTMSEDSLLTIEIYALSDSDKQVAIDSLQKLVIDE